VMENAGISCSPHVVAREDPRGGGGGHTCLSLPEGLLQLVGPHVLVGRAHRQLLAAHPFSPEVKLYTPAVRRMKTAVAPVRNAVTHIPGGGVAAARRTGRESNAGPCRLLPCTCLSCGQK